jgi:hypothetical protein
MVQHLPTKCKVTSPYSIPPKKEKKERKAKGNQGNKRIIGITRMLKHKEPEPKT